MKTIASSAPGKLVLLGEYAVLFGHPAVVLAVNRRARVTLAPADGDHWSVAAPGFEDRPVAFDLERERGFRWRRSATDAAARLVLVEKTIGSLLAAKLLDPEVLPPAVITLDTREFFRSASGGAAKLGLGSSAALAVALTEALHSWSNPGQLQPTIDLARLLDLHRTFQGGRGSGVDLAASFTGGLVEYCLTDGGRTPTAASLELPDNLHLVFVWTGRSASTGDFLARLEARMEDDRGPIADALARLGRISSKGTAHLGTGDVSRFLCNVSDFGAAMEQLGRAAGIPILSEEHLTLRRLAEDVGVSYKPSGAGGGDVGIGFTDDPGLAAAFAASAANAGFSPLDLEIDPVGVDSEF